MEVNISKSCISCHPKFAKKKVYTGTETISGQRLNEINTWLTRGDDAAAFGLTMVIGVSIAAVAAGVTVTTAPFAVALASQGDKVYAAMKTASWQTALGYVGYQLFQSSSNVSDPLLNKIKNRTVPEFKVAYTFKYVQHGGNDGAYFLTKLDLL